MYREQLILIDYTDFRTKIGYYIPVIVAYIVFLVFFLNKVYGRIVISQEISDQIMIR